MKFIHLTDLHLVANGKTLHGGDPAKRLDHCLRDIEQWHGDAQFCVVSGDLADIGDRETYSWLQDRLARFSIPCFLMLGNHDDRAVFQSVFAQHPKDPNGFVQHTHTTDAGVFIFLDTLKDGQGVHEGQLCNKRLAWLKAQLIAAGDEPCYIFMHHPPFDLGIAFVDRIKLVEGKDFAETLAFGRNIRQIFYGHVHRMTYVNWRGFSFTSLPSLNHQVPLNPASVTKTFCNEPPAYGVVQVAADQLSVHFNTFLEREPMTRK